MVTHSGGIEVKSAAGSLALKNFAVDTATGRVTAEVTGGALVEAPVADLLQVRKGKKQVAKGKWTGGKLYLAKTIDLGTGPIDPTVVVNSLLGTPDLFKTGQKLGRINMKWGEQS